MAIYQTSKTGGATFAGLTYQVKDATITKNGIAGIAKFPAMCSDVDDQLTTYVNIKVWEQTLQKFISPPYVDCGYVV